MARTYYVTGFSTVAEGDSLDAHTARVLLQGNVEAVYEEDSYDQNIIYAAPSDLSNTVRMGPWAIPARRDRDGLYRAVEFSPLVSGGGSGMKARLFLTQRYYLPDADLDEYIDFTVSTGTTVAWQTAQTFTPPRYWEPQRATFPDGDEIGAFRHYWASLLFSGISGSPAPTFCGIHIKETVDS